MSDNNMTFRYKRYVSTDRSRDAWPFEWVIAFFSEPSHCLVRHVGSAQLSSSVQLSHSTALQLYPVTQQLSPQ